MLTLNKLERESKKHLSDVIDLFGLEFQELYRKAKLVKINKLPRLRFFAPLYVSSLCGSNCGYCGFRKGSGIKRKTLSLKECRKEVGYLAGQGLDTVYCLTGSFREGNIHKFGTMTEINSRGLLAIKEANLFPVLESSPFSLENLKSLLNVVRGDGRYVLFQECYNRSTYFKLHKGDRYKGTPDERLQQIDLAIQAGWPEVGIGFLVGLHDDIISELSYLISHYYYLKDKVRKITISVPRITNARRIIIDSHSSDETFLKTVCIVRLLCPDAYIVITGRETKNIRDNLKMITHIWGVNGSTVPGGYTLGTDPSDGQFVVKDKRRVKEI